MPAPEKLPWLPATVTHCARIVWCDGKLDHVIWVAPDYGAVVYKPWPKGSDRASTDGFIERRRQVEYRAWNAETLELDAQTMLIVRAWLYDLKHPLFTRGGSNAHESRAQA